ncbi:MAG: carboxylating nicotinate-nucleotide diphosphorylase [Candidatus Hydrothermarchaeales archaeon]
MAEMIDKLLELLSEDLGTGDITTDSILPKNAMGQAAIIANETGVVAGVREAGLLFDHLGLDHDFLKKDGQGIIKGETLVDIHGGLRDILRVERLVLNILSRLSGIATLTSEFSGICRPYGVRVMGTRKTTPGFRAFEKRAIEMGGGLPHRMGLFDAVLIKDNHISAVGLKEAVKEARIKNPGERIEVEVSSLEAAAEAIHAGAEIIMLDNLSPDEAREHIEKLEELGLRRAVEIELSGGIGRNNVKAYAKAGADRISVGALTTGSKWFDYSLKIV